MEQERKLNRLELLSYAIEENMDGTHDLNASVCDLIRQHVEKETYQRFITLMNELGVIISEAVMSAEAHLEVVSANE